MDTLDNGKLTKRERKLLKKEQREIESLALARRKKIRKTAIISLVVIAVAVSFWGLAFSFKKSNKEAPKIEINPREIDAGNVSMATGLLRESFEIANTGSKDLEILAIWTSCHCTTAILKVDGRESPVFGMNRSIDSWSEKIAPGAKGQLEVVFDPAFHGPSGLGPAVRAINLLTNDPQNKEAEVRLVANVIN